MSDTSSGTKSFKFLTSSGKVPLRKGELRLDNKKEILTEDIPTQLFMGESLMSHP